MGKVVLYMQVSLDGVVSDVEQWMNLSDEILEDALAYYDTLDAIVIGGHSYSSMAAYWQQAEDASDSALERRFAKRINELPKIVISRSEQELTWRNSQLLTYRDLESFRMEIEHLKSSTTKDISVESGVRTWRLFLKSALVDELRLLVHPVVAAKGDKLFDEIETQQAWKLSGTKVFSNGVVELHYRISE
ncbi:dihydrofolate reductase family protein [Brevibacillus choshinensis]|uniref:Dihydrofolate reductase family protein n=1 Tax=Brevibacillus choshinensis TaxID=54911 RepID=A0ABX7FRZ5_BRECH|nr:dihydrofolate reductase family protein [Brevibacillus choshinensis]QRG69018.1 dihydrofolate reductase family protein [Brevibacillus choshinensis]